MQVRYHVAHDGHQIGPFEFAEIEAQLNDKTLFPTDYVYVTDGQPRWMSILDFVMVYGPKKVVTQPTLVTDGARHSADSQLDWQRFSSGLPMSEPQVLEEKSDSEISQVAYPTVPPETTVKPIAKPSTAPEFPPPVKAPRAIIEKRLLEAAVRKPSFPIARPAPQDAPAPKVKPSRPAPPRVVAPVTAPVQTSPARTVDITAVAQVEVRPARATRLHISIDGEARVGEILEVTVHAISEAGALDTTFDEIVHLGCNRPVQGLAALQFVDGVARLQVRCLASGAHQFYLTMEASPAQKVSYWQGTQPATIV